MTNTDRETLARKFADLNARMRRARTNDERRALAQEIAAVRDALKQASA